MYKEKLTPREEQVLDVCLSPKTSYEVCELLGISYAYGIKLLRSLVRSGNLKAELSGKPGGGKLYITKYLGESITKIPNSLKARRFSVYHKGEALSLAEALTKFNSFSILQRAMYQILAALTLHSQRTKDSNTFTFNPLPRDLEVALQSLIRKLKLDIALAENILASPIWTRSEHVQDLIGLNLTPAAISSLVTQLEDDWENESGLFKDWSKPDE